MSGDVCDVCGQQGPTQVGCSVTGAISFAYCADCLRSGREPYGAVVARLIGITNMDGVAEWFKPIIRVTLEAENKTEEELFAEVARFEAGYEEYCNSEKSTN